MTPAGRTCRPDVLVIVPARDEVDSIGDCLTSVCRSLASAQGEHAVGRVRVAVAAHRCSDATAALARELLVEHGVDHLVTDDTVSRTVGEVRSRLVAQAMEVSPRLDPEGTWLLSTDADTVVPLDWVATFLRVGASTRADLVAGYVDLDPSWDVTVAARTAYDALLRSPADASGHTHVWAANLAVRHAAYRLAGGFPAVAHGEERALADRVSQHGTVVGSFVPRVTTSARMPGRARDGLGDLLRRLAQDHRADVEEWPGAGTALA